MPNPLEIEIKVLEEAAPTVEHFLEELPAVFGSAGKTFHESNAAQEVAARLFKLPPQAESMRDMLRAALGTNHAPTLASVKNFFSMPTEIRTLLGAKDLGDMTGLLRQGTPESLGSVRSTLGALGELSPYAARDKTDFEVLQSVRNSGILGDNPWVGRRVTMATKGA